MVGYSPAPKVPAAIHAGSGEVPPLTTTLALQIPVQGQRFFRAP
ncbi:hypothetical protein SAMN02927900_05574 [Rhizobium mongolense subsp. loessense]|uniref:Uncharacterized protein n=1 Tax=Rhizobium mongolense subsp. loessense TaxID=158890 RepID=A0A1G4TV57_9HYPH|nr:hypothetical protein SAMN02927900_05574 [Rhizobium mongolense subsp. loessense]